MKTLVVPLIALALGFSCAADAKIVGRWDPVAFAEGRFEVEKTAFVNKEKGEESLIEIIEEELVVEIDYKGRLKAKKEKKAEPEKKEK